MSLVVVMEVREGIVMAADSRLSLDTTTNQPNGQVVNLSVGQSDTSRKLFLTDGIGIGTYGQADITGVPLAGFIDSFVATIYQQVLTPQGVANKLLAYFTNMQPIPKTYFFVAGYDKSKNPTVSEVWLVNVAGNSIVQHSQNQQGMSWGGEIDIASRLVQKCGHFWTQQHLATS